MFLQLFLNVRFYTTEMKTTTRNTSFPGRTVGAQVFHKQLYLNVGAKSTQLCIPRLSPEECCTHPPMFLLFFRFPSTQERIPARENVSQCGNAEMQTAP